MDSYKQYIKTKVVGTDTLVIDGYSDWQTDKYDPVDTQLSGTFERHFQTQLTNARNQYLYKIVSGQMVARTQTEIDAEYAARPIPPDPDTELANAINAATDIPTLKSALLGINGGRVAKVSGKLK